MKSATVPALIAGLLATSAAASATWVTIPLVRTPQDAGRYTIQVAHQPLPHGGTRYIVTLRLKEAHWPMRIIPALTQVVPRPHGLESIPKRKLAFAENGAVRKLAFDVSKTEARHWHFQLDEYGEVGGHLMPSVNSYLFPLNHPPKDGPKSG